MTIIVIKLHVMSLFLSFIVIQFLFVFIPLTKWMEMGDKNEEKKIKIKKERKGLKRYSGTTLTMPEIVT